MRTTTLLAALLLVGTAVAAAPDSPPPLDLDKAAAAAQIADPAAAAAAYLDAVPTERRAKTKAYALGNYVLDVVEAGWDVLVYAALLAFGVSARLRDRAERLIHLVRDGRRELPERGQTRGMRELRVLALHLQLGEPSPPALNDERRDE